MELPKVKFWEPYEREGGLKWCCKFFRLLVIFFISENRQPALEGSFLKILLPELLQIHVNRPSKKYIKIITECS